GVRMAMGAQRSDVHRMVLSRGMWLVGAGVGAGLAAALGVTRFLETFLFGVKPYDGVTLAGAIVLFALVAAAACWAPARRAMRVDPLKALHYE
ncbi:MAG TPA: FtsX-like permease family protein, partial [Candidatus Acidoferrales bacterium]|nr:FtsX-like permease family protein [Candidatus Acidoferrales bacterium]